MPLSSVVTYQNPVANKQQPLRLFLDTGVILAGLYSSWGASKAVLIHATYRELYTVVFAEAVARELYRNISGTAAIDLNQWIRRVRLERWPMPMLEEVRGYEPTLLPVLCHTNDLPAVVTVMQAQPDWVISANSAHWSEALAAHIGLRILTPHDFVSRLRPS